MNPAQTIIYLQGIFLQNKKIQMQKSPRNQEISVFILLVQVLTTLMTLMQASHTEHAPFAFCVMLGTEGKAVNVSVCTSSNTTESQ